LTIYVQQVLQSNTNDLTQTRNFLESGPSPAQQYAECLLAILLHLECDRHRQPELTMQYPPNSLHARAVEVISTNTVNNPDLRRLEIAGLFGSELVEHRTVNFRIYDLMALNCRNDDERHILAEIGVFLKRLPHHA